MKMAEITDNSGIGRLIVQASTASGALPIVNAKVTVEETDGRVIEVLMTDNSGRTRAVELSAPDAEYSQTPGDVVPYKAYNVRVEKQGFYTEELRNVAVFDGINSIQPVALEPLGENSTEDDKINIINETAPMQV